MFGYYENIFICIFNFKILLYNRSLGNASLPQFSNDSELGRKKKKETMKQHLIFFSFLMFIIGSDMNVVLLGNKDQENKHDGETKPLHYVLIGSMC